MLSTGDNLLRSAVLNAKITTVRGNNHSLPPTLRSSGLPVSPTLAYKCNVLLRRNIRSNRPVVTNNLSFVNPYLYNDTTKVSASLPPPDVKLTPERKAEIELKRDLSLLEGKGVKCVILHWRHFLRFTWSNILQKGGHDISKTPIISSRSFVDAASPSRSVPEELNKDEVSEMPHVLGTVLKLGGYAAIIFSSMSSTSDTTHSRRMFIL